MKYKVSFVGREVGAIGSAKRFNLNIEANCPSAARLKVYETHEHISQPKMIEVDNKGKENEINFFGMGGN